MDMMAYKQQLREEFGQAVEVKNPESLDRLLNLIVDRLGDTEQPATSVRHIEQFIKRLEENRQYWDTRFEENRQYWDTRFEDLLRYLNKGFEDVNTAL